MFLMFLRSHWRHPIDPQEAISAFRSRSAGGLSNIGIEDGVTRPQVETSTVEMRMTTCRLALVAIIGVASMFALQTPAQARSPSDGRWSVAIFGQSGSCQGGSYQYELQIVNGIVYYGGSDARITGRVNERGAVYVRVSTSDRSAVGSGRLSRNVGWGTFRGQAPSGICAGTWSARRTGG
jgi:hypothetical protein